MQFLIALKDDYPINSIYQSPPSKTSLTHMGSTKLFFCVRFSLSRNKWTDLILALICLMNLLLPSFWFRVWWFQVFFLRVRSSLASRSQMLLLLLLLSESDSKWTDLERFEDNVIVSVWLIVVEHIYLVGYIFPAPSLAYSTSMGKRILQCMKWDMKTYFLKIPWVINISGQFYLLSIMEVY